MKHKKSLYSYPSTPYILQYMLYVHTCSILILINLAINTAQYIQWYLLLLLWFNNHHHHHQFNHPNGLLYPLHSYSIHSLPSHTDLWKCTTVFPILFMNTQQLDHTLQFLSNFRSLKKKSVGDWRNGNRLFDPAVFSSSLQTVTRESPALVPNTVFNPSHWVPNGEAVDCVFAHFASWILSPANFIPIRSFNVVRVRRIELHVVQTQLSIICRLNGCIFQFSANRILAAIL